MDIRTVYRDFGGDWQALTPGLAEDDGLETAVIISLFTDRRAEPDDELPAGDDRRGWWGDALAEVPGDRIGSRLWLLSREKQLSRVLPKAREYALEALQWLVEDGVALAVDVTAEIAGPGILGLLVEIRRPGAGPVKYRFERFWNTA